MKTIYRFLLVVIYIAFINCAEAANKEILVSGAVVFSADFKQSVMEKNGYKFIGEGTFGEFKTNFFGAKEAEFVVKNNKGEIIGIGKSKADGSFALSLELSKFYQFAVEYRGRKIEKTISSSDAIKAIQLDVGRFSDMSDIHY